MSRKRFLLHPAWGRGRGSGHLRRAISLRRSLQARGETAILRLEGDAPEGFGLGADEWLSGDGIEAGAGDILVADRFRSGASDLASWGRAGLRVGIDEGGPLRDAFDCLIDILPGKRPAPAPNAGLALGFLDLPPRRERPVGELGRVLVSFGGEDPARLGPATVSALLSAGLPAASISFLRGPLGPGLPDGAEGVRSLEATGDLASLLGEWDLVITAYGLTAWEAIASGAAVLLAHPSPYHASLARQTGFPSLGSGAGAPDPRKAAAVLAEPDRILEASARLRSFLDDAVAATPGEGKSGSARLASFLADMEPTGLGSGRRCVSCLRTGRPGPGLWRDPKRTYRRCPSCGTASMTRFGPNPLTYGRSYFFEEYKAQYGKTYLEDFPALQAMADRRLDRLEVCLRRSFPREGAFRVLDLGCAYGAFLERARARGWEAVGVDPAEDAIRHCRDELSLEAFPGAFPSAMPPLERLGGPFHAVTLWFVIEHLDDGAAALDSLRGLLVEGGILALSTPSGRGVSARLNADSFWRSSPLDHLSVLDPRSVRSVLGKKGFKLLAAPTTGHHPERFPCHPRRGSAAFRALGAFSRAFAWGDTFEAYARKEGG